MLAWFHANQNPHYPVNHTIHHGYVGAIFVPYCKQVHGIRIEDRDLETETFTQRVRALTPKWMLEPESDIHKAMHAMGYGPRRGSDVVVDNPECRQPRVRTLRDTWRRALSV